MRSEKMHIFDDYTRQLKYCAHPDEVFILMEGRIFPNSNQSLFDDKLLMIRKNAVKFRAITPPSGMIGLAYRTVLYLILDGEMGDAPINGGNFQKADYLERVLRELQLHGGFYEPSSVNSKILDDYISVQREIGNSELSIYQKLFTLELWVKHNYLLPFFLQLPHDLFASSEQWKSLLIGKQKENIDYLNGVGSSKTPYPLDQLSIVITEALDYIDTYSEDCIWAAQFYKDAKAECLLGNDIQNNLTKIFRKTGYCFTEPLLAVTQQHTRSLRNNTWLQNSNTKGKTAVTACLDAVNKLQAACVIVVLMLTAMRKGELEVMIRYPKAKKTRHYELDGSFEIEKLIYKTAETDKGEVHPIAVPSIVTKALFLLSRISEIGDGKQVGPINLMSLNRGVEENDHARINKLVNAFCENLSIIPPTPHQLRHAMAFLVAYLNDDIGIELAMTLLGHKSISMTRVYMGHYKQVILKALGVMFNENLQMKKAVAEFQAEQSSQALEKIIRVIEEDEPLAGPIVKRLLQGVEFTGSITNEGKVFFAKSQRLLLERGMLAIVEHPTHFCVRDLTDSAQMPCQIGLDIDDFTNVPVISAQCQNNCGCRLYTEPQVEEMKRLSLEMEEHYPEDLIELIKGNRFYIANSFEQTFSNVIEELELKKQQKEEKHG